MVAALAIGGKVMLSAPKGDAAKGKVVFEQCAVCHGGKEGRLLGTIVYEIPVK